MSVFTILVTSPPLDTQSGYTALRFTEAALEKGHQVKGIFFYQAGVHHCNQFQAGHSDELNIYRRWCSLNQQHQTPLQVCVTAANRRGVINQQDADELDLGHHNLSAPFEEVGLGEFIQLTNQSDRMIQF